MKSYLAGASLCALLFPTAAMADPHWASAAKTAVGTAYEAYTDGKYVEGGASGHVSKVWFSVADGVLTETMFGEIHQAQIRDLKFRVSGDGWTATEGDCTDAKTEYLATDAAGRPQSLAYRITTTDRKGRFRIVKDIFTDPDRDSLMMRVTIEALKGPVSAVLQLDPHMANTAGGDRLGFSDTGFTASEGDKYLHLKTTATFTAAGVAEDVIRGSLGTIEKSMSFDLAIGFGTDAKSAHHAAKGTLKDGYDKVLASYNAGWAGYLATLAPLPKLVATTTDDGKLLYASALVLKAHEDKTHAGALVASLSNPWGGVVPADKAHTGYKAVWPRDFYECAMAFLALGDTATPKAALDYLPKVQAGPNIPGYKGTPGWFLQKTVVNGTIEWVGVQLDQTAMPIMLAARLHDAGVITDADLKGRYAAWIKPAADFLVTGGKVAIDWNKTTIKPPFTQQERWEEQPGVSASTTAAVIAGLSTASRIAALAGDDKAAKRYGAAAKADEAKLDPALLTTTGPFGKRYYVRISPDGKANSGKKLLDNNGHPGMDARQIMDGGFLELVRYGVRAADDGRIVDSVTAIDAPLADDNLRVRYDFKVGDVSYPGFRRYGNDGYGEKTSTGTAWYVPQTADMRGRVWPLLTGERGHYELAKGADTESLRKTYVGAIEHFANDGLMIPEQVFDGVGEKGAMTPGEGTDSATPLAWAHAEYVKLVRSVTDGKIWDQDPKIVAEFAGTKK